MHTPKEKYTTSKLATCQSFQETEGDIDYYQVVNQPITFQCQICGKNR